MSYIELGSAAFRGELRGATGFFKGSLTADAIDAVDTVNIAGGQITYSTLATYTSKAVSNGGVAITTVINVPDASAFVEIQVFCHGGGTVYVDGGARDPTSMGRVGNRMVPYSELILLSGGNHTITVISGYNGVSAMGYVHVQYIRKTGA